MEEAKKKKIKLKQVEGYKDQIELLQEFEFSVSS
jgi:hypothetical protein